MKYNKDILYVCSLNSKLHNCINEEILFTLITQTLFIDYTIQRMQSKQHAHCTSEPMTVKCIQNGFLKW